MLDRQLRGVVVPDAGVQRLGKLIKRYPGRCEEILERSAIWWRVRNSDYTAKARIWDEIMRLPTRKRTQVATVVLDQLFGKGTNVRAGELCWTLFNSHADMGDRDRVAWGLLRDWLSQPGLGREHHLGPVMEILTLQATKQALRYNNHRLLEVLIQEAGAQAEGGAVVQRAVDNWVSHLLEYTPISRAAIETSLDLVLGGGGDFRAENEGTYALARLVDCNRVADMPFLGDNRRMAVDALLEREITWTRKELRSVREDLREHILTHPATVRRDLGKVAGKRCTPAVKRTL